MVIQEKYGILMDASFSHDFFSSGIAEGMTPRLSPASTRFVNDFNLLFRPTTSGFTFLYNKDRYKIIPVSQLRGKKITLELDRPEDIFFNYTDIDGFAGNKLFYFTNLRAQKPEGEENPLSKTTYTGTADLYDWYAGNFQMTCTPGTETSYKLADLFGGEYAPAISSPGKMVFTPSPGAYTLTKDGAAQKNIYVSDRNQRVKPFGIIELGLFDDRMAPEYAVFSTEESLSPAYNIHFGARATTWRYYIVNRTKVDIENVVIRSNNGVSFLDGGTMEVAAGNGKVFLSEKPIALKQKPVQKFFLSYKNIGNNSMEVNIVENVPMPSVDHIFPDKNAVYSDVYIYV